jgi:hypothetical protein
MGAGESEFWQARLRQDAERSPSKNEIPRSQDNTKTNAVSLTTPLKKPDVKPAQIDVADQTLPKGPSSKRRTATWPWLAGILVLAVIAGLIWKRRA